MLLKPKLALLSRKMVVYHHTAGRWLKHLFKLSYDVILPTLIPIPVSQPQDSVDIMRGAMVANFTN